MKDQTYLKVRWLAYMGITYVASTLVYLYLLEKLLNRNLDAPFAQAFKTLKTIQALLVPVIGFSVIFHVALVTTLTIFGIAYLSRRHEKSVSLLEDFAGRLNEGDLRPHPDFGRPDKLRELVQASGDLRDRLAGQLREVGQSLDRIKEYRQKLTPAAGMAQVEEAPDLREILLQIENELNRMGRTLRS